MLMGYWVGKPEGKRPLGRLRRRWVVSIKMDLREIGWDDVVWIGLIWLRMGTSGGLFEYGFEPQEGLSSVSM
jgi:hypothetical protein